MESRHDPIERERRKLTPVQREAWVALNRASALLRARMEKNLRQRHALDLDDYDILMSLWEAGELRMGELGRRLLYSRSRICHRIEKLEQAGLVERHEIEADGRGYVAVLSKMGRARLREAVQTKRKDLEDILFGPLSEPETRSLATLMTKIRDSLEDPYVAPDF